MSVRCKMHCYSKMEFDPGQYPPDGGRPLATHEIELIPSNDPVYGPYTPMGKVTIRIVPQAARLFEVGKPYLVTFEPLEG